MTNLSKTITMNAGSLQVPNTITIPFISGDGIGPEITNATQKIITHALEIAYHSQKSIIWKEVLAGEKAFQETGEWLPEDTLNSFEKYLIGMKGPLTTPVGEGIR